MKKKVLVVVISIIALIAILWITGVIPKIIGINTAKKYVNENYKEMNLQYETIEFSSAYGDYIVRFVDENNNTYNFMVSPKYLPIEIMYDSIESNTEGNTEEKAADNFEIIFNARKDLGIKTIVSADESDKYSYNIYSLGGDISVRIGDNEYDLTVALLDDKITMEEIIEKANDDLENKIIEAYMYQDGGSTIYRYNDYSILKYNTLDGNKDVYIGVPYMTMEHTKGVIAQQTKMIQVNGKLYINNGEESTVTARCGNMDGKITTNVNQDEIPTKDNQSNFNGNYEYQYGAENTIEVKFDDKWYVFRQKEEYESQNINKENLEDVFDIGNKIENIISNGNQDSSNPYDYINANKQIYNELLEHPKETFEYSIKDLIDTNASNGLVGYIETILCSEINKNFQYDFSSANDYLEKYKEFLSKSDTILNDYDTYTKSLLN